MAATTTYQHDNLPLSTSIRLLTLEPGAYTDKLVGRLEVADLESDPAYDAISYVWGAPDQKATISISSSDGDKDLEIPANLAAALRRLRNESTAVVFWTDSICINQADHDERRQQVRIMGEIYAIARQVRVWLGEPDDEAQLRRALDCMEALVRCRPEQRELEKQPSSTSEMHLANFNSDHLTQQGLPHSTHDEIHRLLNLPLLASLDFDDLSALFNNDWCSRAWTWQETFVAQKRTFYCGPFSWDSAKVVVTCHVLHKLNERRASAKYGEISNKMNAMVTGKDFWAIAKNRGLSTAWLDLGPLIGLRRGSKCKYPSDLVYSLLGAAENCPQIDIDYEVPFETVFAKTTFAIILQRGDLQILRDRERDREESVLPSWVPDWREPDLLQSGITNWNETSRYAATKTLRPVVRLSEDAKMLTVSGSKISKVSVVDEVGNSSYGSDWFDRVSRYVDSEVDGEKIYDYTHESLDHALRRVHFRDWACFTTETPRRWHADSHEQFDGVITSKLQNDGPDAIRAYEVLQHSMFRMAELSKYNFITESGQLGVTPAKVLPGDIVAALFGGEVLYLLRPEKEAGSYKFVSECYLHGFMDGECLVYAGKIAGLELESNSSIWLEQLDSANLPFAVQEFRIV